MVVALCLVLGVCVFPVCYDAVVLAVAIVVAYCIVVVFVLF